MPGKLVLLVPSRISASGVNELEGELDPRGVTILGKDANLILARLDENSRQAIAEGLSIQEFFVDKVRPTVIRQLPEPVARIATLWNWSIDKRGRRVTNAEVRRVMKKLQLEVRDDQVYDRLTRTNVGRVESGETETQ